MNGFRMHFVGIKGTGMAALVEICAARGAVITGSDVEERFYTDEILEKLGIKPLSFSKDNIGGNGKPLPDIVVYSSAYKLDVNPDLIEACAKGVKCVLYTEALGAVSAASYSVGICGVHGKTTVTGMSGTLISSLGLPAQILAGSAVKSFGGSCTLTAGHKYFVAETCEYQRHFMAFHPKKIVLTSVESDHQDFYPTFKDIQNAFVDYICLLPEKGQLIYCADDAGAVETAEIARKKRPDIDFIPYGTNADGDYKLTFGTISGGYHNFNVSCLGGAKIKVPGDHNVRNACAAVALCVELIKSDGKNPADYMEEIRRGLLNFSGGKRRSEIVGRAVNKYGQNVIFIDDYGHHPTAIKTTLAGFRDFYKGYKIIVDFMSHTYTRTAALLEEFASSFESADTVIINKIYGSAREDASAAKVTGEILAERAKKYHSDVIYAGEFDEAARIAEDLLQKNALDPYSEGYLFVTMGAGDNWKVGSKLLDSMGGKKSSGGDGE